MWGTRGHWVCAQIRVREGCGYCLAVVVSVAARAKGAGRCAARQACRTNKTRTYSHWTVVREHRRMCAIGQGGCMAYDLDVDEDTSNSDLFL